MKNILGLIGGSGIYSIPFVDIVKEHTYKSAFGEPSGSVYLLRYNSLEFYFIPRHGMNHNINPSKINYRANIDSLKHFGVTDIVSLSAVGSMKREHEPGEFIIIDQYVDKTFLRKNSFFTGSCVAHVSMAYPVSKELSDLCEYSLNQTRIKFKSKGTYLAIEGPQFSSLAESKLFKDLNVDVIGMTNMPEAKLAREAEIRYASIGMITDYDCWNHEYRIASVDSILSIMKQNTEKTNYFLKYLFENFYTDKLIDDSIFRCLDKSIVTKINNVDKKDLRKLENILKRYIKENAK
tara:strand:- start:706 stop:1584 length:879 start_codon:yes stop_codon:yes gene_type:complete